MPNEFKFIDRRNQLFGREDDIEYLLRRAERPGLTALVGPPRMGKTWLVQEFARRMCENHDFLIGYDESHGEGDLIRAAVADLYFRWFSGSSFGEQAKVMWRSKKEGFFARFTAKTVEFVSDIVEAVPVYGAVAKPFLKAGEKLFAALADANPNLRGQNLAQDLTYDHVSAIVSMLAEVTDRRIILVLDAFDQIPDTGKQFGVLNGFMSNIVLWPHTHIFAPVRQNEKGEPAGESAALCRLYPRAEVRTLGRMALDDAEKARLASHVGGRVSAARNITPDELAKMTEGCPDVVGRWLARADDISSLDDLVQEAHNAIRNLHPEFGRFREMPTAQKRLGMRLAVMRQFRDRDDWEFFKGIVLEGLPDADLGHLQGKRVLETTDYPTYGHATRHRNALDWFAEFLPAPLAEEIDHIVRRVAARVREMDEDSRPFMSALSAMALPLIDLKIISSTAKEVLLFFVFGTIDGLNDKSRRKLMVTSARQATAWPDCAALLAFVLYDEINNAKKEDDLLHRDAALQGLRDLMKEHPDNPAVRKRLAGGLLHTHNHAKEEDDLPRRDALLQELRELRKEHPDDPAVREQLAMTLFNTHQHAKEEDDLPRRDALLQELRELRKEHPDDPAVRKWLASGLFNELLYAKQGNEPPRCDGLLQELRELREEHPDDPAVRNPLARGLFNTLNHAKAEDNLPRRDALLQELRELRKDHPDDAAVREWLAGGLGNTLNYAKDEEDLPRRDTLLQELRELSADHPDSPAVRKQLAGGLYNTLNHAKDEKNLPRRDALLQELRELSADHPDAPSVRKRLAMGLFNTLNHAKDEKDLPRRDALLQELRELSADHPDAPVVRELLARELVNTLNDAKGKNDLPRRDAILQELRKLRKDHLDDPAVRGQLAMGLFNTLNHAKDEKDLPRRDALLQELRELRKEHADDRDMRKCLAQSLFNMLFDAKQEDDLPRRDALLQELRELRREYTNDQDLLELLAKGLSNTLYDAKDENNPPPRDALLDELRELRRGHPDNPIARKSLAMGLSFTLNDAKSEGNLPRRDALLQELRDLSEKHPEDEFLSGMLTEINGDLPPTA